MEHQSLWQHYKQNHDLQTKNELIEKYIALVKIIAGRLYTSYGSNVDYDDLVSYGIFGLIDAIEKFDINKNVKFETYAQIRIRGAIIDQLRNLDWVPRSIRQKSKKIEDAYAKAENRLGRSVLDFEVAQELEMSIGDFHRTLQQINSFNIVSLEERLSDTHHNQIPIGDENDLPEQIICNKEERLLLRSSIESLSEREKTVVTLYYYEGFTYKEIGQVLDVSESRVSQLHSKAIVRLKGVLKLG
ncbi:RNA polymerase, sigma 28 subunit, FliA/WhiG [Alkaliphilus metalliredigens QYMF]|uniref:RNA polymerase sigma factor n=1 Tax=Alkaliphilus metalliredigens (strain QYMF) TaxID=293826 RepID=A6TRM8_ALKMQ|nr:FliA/WhiG family RNA polymerase sigma factor [Alkaliphilus metalliredigens]ABR48846.1 RNA polymerase, sigma 28 subunit, FliA/WhiG [Alkaliphilus metalliredigens QYMF]